MSTENTMLIRFGIGSLLCAIIIALSTCSWNMHKKLVDARREAVIAKVERDAAIEASRNLEVVENAVRKARDEAQAAMVNAESLDNDDEYFTALGRLLKNDSENRSRNASGDIIH